jgi:hypothetical protein
MASVETETITVPGAFPASTDEGMKAKAMCQLEGSADGYG